MYKSLVPRTTVQIKCPDTACLYSAPSCKRLPQQELLSMSSQSALKNQVGPYTGGVGGTSGVGVGDICNKLVRTNLDRAGYQVKVGMAEIFHLFFSLHESVSL